MLLQIIQIKYFLLIYHETNVVFNILLLETAIIWKFSEWMWMFLTLYADPLLAIIPLE